MEGISTIGLDIGKSVFQVHAISDVGAEAICEAVTRPTMRFVPVKTVDQQSVLMLHRTRQLFIRQRTTLINSIRAHLAEFIAGIGRNGVEALLAVIGKGEEQSVPPEARSCLIALAEQLELVKRQILDGPTGASLASRQQPEPEPRKHPRYWPAHLDRFRRERSQLEGLPLWSRP
jgi:transposase